jgi:hypothetical protein
MARNSEEEQSSDTEYHDGVKEEEKKYTNSVKGR